MANRLINPKWELIQFFDSMIQKIDIHTEEQLEKLTENSFVPKNIMNPNEESNIPPDVQYYFDNDYMRGVRQIDSYLDPYLSYEFEPKESRIEVKSEKLRDYINHIREEMLNELKKARQSALENYESIKHELNFDTFLDKKEAIENLYRKTFDRKFWMIFYLDEIREIDVFSNEVVNVNSSPFKLYLCEFDFYLDPKEQMLLRYYLDGDFNFDATKRNEFISGQKIENNEIKFNNRMLLLSMLNQCIRNRTNDLELGFHILRLKKEQILKVPKFFAKSLYFGLPFDRLVIDLDCPPQDENLDFSNIKSLAISSWFTEIGSYQLANLKNFSQLRILALLNITLGNDPLVGLVNLCNLSLSHCNFGLLPHDYFVCLPQLEVLENSFPTKSAHITYQGLDNLKMLSLIMPESFDFLKKLQEFNPNLEVLKINNQSFQLDCDIIFENLRHSSLISLYLEGIYASKFDAECLSELPCLKNLFLFYSPIQEVDFDYEFLLKLESIGLRCLSVEKLDFGFEKLNNLKSLQLFSNSRLQLNSNIFVGLENLEELYIDLTEQQTFEENLFCKLKNLKILQFNGNHKTKIDSDVFKNNSNLLKLSLHENQSNFDASIFKYLNQLVFLDLNTNRLTTVEDFWSSLEKLETLNLDNNNLTEVTKKTFLGLRKLKYLCLRDNPIQKINLDAFDDLGNLEQVVISKTKISNQNREELRKRHKNINFFN